MSVLSQLGVTISTVWTYLILARFGAVHALEAHRDGPSLPDGALWDSAAAVPTPSSIEVVVFIATVTATLATVSWPLGAVATIAVLVMTAATAWGDEYEAHATWRAGTRQPGATIFLTVMLALTLVVV